MRASNHAMHDGAITLQIRTAVYIWEGGKGVHATPTQRVLLRAPFDNAAATISSKAALKIQERAMLHSREWCRVTADVCGQLMSGRWYGLGCFQERGRVMQERLRVSGLPTEVCLLDSIYMLRPERPYVYNDSICRVLAIFVQPDWLYTAVRTYVLCTYRAEWHVTPTQRTYRQTSKLLGTGKDCASDVLRRVYMSMNTNSQELACCVLSCKAWSSSHAPISST